MVIDVKLRAPPGTSLRSLVKGYLLIHQAGGSSPNTVKYYRGNLRENQNSKINPLANGKITEQE